jgi:hypothetical protein
VLCLARTVRRAKWRQTSLPGPNVLHLQQALRRRSGVSTCPFGAGPPPRCVVLCVPRPKLFYLSTPSHVASLHATLHRFGRRIALLHSSTTHTHTGGGPQVSNGSEHNRLPQKKCWRLGARALKTPCARIACCTNSKAHPNTRITAYTSSVCDSKEPQSLKKQEHRKGAARLHFCGRPFCTHASEPQKKDAARPLSSIGVFSQSRTPHSYEPARALARGRARQTRQPLQHAKRASCLAPQQWRAAHY